MTFYLKYRPQSIADLDQKDVRLSLEKIIKSKNIPHAFLFSGPKGTGKTSAARILAKIINCENEGSEPCNECDQCTTIAKGQNIDVIEIDAASHRGIEDIRMIRDAVKLSPAKARKKVYIIDEAHMLTTEASNALLKTLEEPPDHVVFILATTNPEKLIDTVRSRVTTIQFKKADSEEITGALKKIAKKEGIKINDGFLGEIVKKADGSFRDAVKIFEQMVLEEVDFEKGIDAYFGKIKNFDSKKFLEFLKNKDTKEALVLIEDSVNSGQGVKEILVNVLERLRNILLSHYGLKESETSVKFEKHELIEIIKLLTDASAKTAGSFIEQVPMEVAVIEWCEGKSGSKNDGVKNGKIEMEEVVKIETKTVATKKVDPPKEEDKNEKKENKVEEKISVIAEGTSNIKVDLGNGNFEPMPDNVWREVLTKVRPGHTSTEALLRAAKPLEFNGSVLKLGVYYKFHKERLEEKQHRDILEEALQIHLGSPVRVVCTLTEPPRDTENHIKEPEVILQEPEKQAAATSVLTDNNNQDIISLAEKIFSN